MDASTVAQILSNDEEANLLTLQTQAFEIMASDYASRNEGREFPLERFSERVYRMRNEDQVTIDDSEFKDEILAMERHKMLLRRVELSDEEGERREVAKWRFRHDKVMDFFLYQAFFDPNEGPKRQVEHISDPRFRGVYLLMATRAPAQIAHELERRLILHAAKTGDHSLSDAFVTLLSERTFETVES